MTNRIKSAILQSFKSIKYANSEKVFCIGLNKTGTTSMAKLFENIGYDVAPQRPGEELMNDWSNNDFKKIVKFVKYGGEVFQDIPFSLPDTYKVLDANFPNCKFILTIRDSPEVWYESLIRFHAKMFNNGQVVDKSDVFNINYIYKGWMWKVLEKVFNTTKEDPYNKEILIKQYTKYNNDVIEHFKNRPSQLLVLNLKDEFAGKKIAKFLGLGDIDIQIPYENKT